VLLPYQRSTLARGTKDKEHAMSHALNTAIAVIGIDIGKNSFHIVGLDQPGAIVLRQASSLASVLPLHEHRARRACELHGTTRLTWSMRHRQKSLTALARSLG
jgi:hypothetical protein